MSGLWTPGGDEPANQASEQLEELTEEELAERMETLRQQIAATPVEQIINQSAYQFFELAALHLSVVPPQMDQAKLAIDAFGLLVEGLEGRLGPDGATLKDGLAQLRMAYVEVSKGGAPPAE